MAPGKVVVRPAKVTVRLALAALTILAKGQKSTILALLATPPVDEERRASVGLAVPETQVMVAMAVAVMAHPHPVMTSHHVPLLPGDQGDRLETLGILVLVPNPV